MQVEELLDLIQNPDKVNTLNRYDLKALLEQHPTFQAAHLLLYLIDGDKKVLAETALHTSNRWVLRQFQSALQDPAREMSAVLEQMHTEPVNAFERLTTPEDTPAAEVEAKEHEEIPTKEPEAEEATDDEPTASEPEATTEVEEPESTAPPAEEENTYRSTEPSPMNAALAYLNESKEEEKETQADAESTLLDDFDLSTESDSTEDATAETAEAISEDAENFFDSIAEDPYEYPKEVTEEFAAAESDNTGSALEKEEAAEPDNFFDSIEEHTDEEDAASPNSTAPDTTTSSKLSQAAEPEKAKESESFFDTIEDENATDSDRTSDVPEELKDANTSHSQEGKSTSESSLESKEEAKTDKEMVLVSQNSIETENFFDSIPDEPYADKQAEVLSTDTNENVLDEVLQSDTEERTDPYSQQDEAVSKGNFFDEIDAENAAFATPLDDYKGKFSVETISDSEPIDPIRWAEDEFGMRQSIHQTAVTGQVTRPAWQLVSTEDMPGEESRDNLPPEVYQVAVEKETAVKVQTAEPEEADNDDSSKEEGDSFFDQF